MPGLFERDFIQRLLPRAATSSDTGRALGLAAAAMATNVISLALTIVFARLLGTSGYGAMAALMSAFLVLGIPGQALQVEFAKRVSTSPDHGRVAGELARWVRFLVAAAATTAVVGLLLRDPIAGLIGVEEVPYGAAGVLPTACIWLLLSVQRGVLQGIGSYRLVGFSLMGEALSRLAVGTALIGAGLGATGAFLGSGVSMAVIAVILGRNLGAALPDPSTLSSRARSMRDTLRGAVVPLVALALLAWLQNVDVIVVKHQAATDASASSYAAASVAAKTIFWVSVGLGLFLLPEAARRSHAGQDGRSVLVRTLGIVALVAVPMVAVYALAGQLLLETVFGSRLDLASHALPWLGAAMSILACGYLFVQYLLAVQSRIFLAALAVAAVAQPFVLIAAGTDLKAVALGLLAIQSAWVAVMAALSFRSRAWAPAPEPQAASQ